MPIHDFDFTPKKIDASGVNEQRSPAIDKDVYKTSAIEPTTTYNNTNKDIEDVKSILPQGFRTMDQGVKNWLSDIYVPTQDSVRHMTVRVAGGDKSFLIWEQDLRSNRIKLPVCSVNRSGWKHHAEKFSPPIHHMRRRFADADGTKVILTFRPVPFLIDYTLSIWAERKRDIEYINYQIVSRFNPIAEFLIQDEYLRGSVQVQYNGASNNSDIDIGAEDLPKVRYDIDITIEGWLPLPEKVVPTVLGRVTTLNEDTGEFLESLDNKGTWNG